MTKRETKVMTVHVGTANPYDVHIGPGLLEKLGDCLPQRVLEKAARGVKAVLLTDRNVGPLYVPAVEKKLEALGFSRVLPVTVPAGEESKSGERYLAVLSYMAQAHVSRSDILFALGGGVVGDLGGFLAATYERGIDFVQLPTTLLAAVDSSVGGKTAINLPEGKNLVGAFYQPKAVVMDVDLLDTLPGDIFADGCAEVIKYGMIWDAGLFETLAARPLTACREDKTYMSGIIARCVAIKEEVVAQDERDTGIRNILNFGHTIGHAVEKNSGFVISHGKAVAIGMVMACRGAEREGLCQVGCEAALRQVLLAYGLPVETGDDKEALAQGMLSDKKIDGSTINLILPRRIGVCEIVTVPVAELAGFLLGAGEGEAR